MKRQLKTTPEETVGFVPDGQRVNGIREDDDDNQTIIDERRLNLKA